MTFTTRRLSDSKPITGSEINMLQQDLFRELISLQKKIEQLALRVDELENLVENLSP